MKIILDISQTEFNSMVEKFTTAERIAAELRQQLIGMDQRHYDLLDKVSQLTFERDNLKSQLARSVHREYMPQEEMIAIIRDIPRAFDFFSGDLEFPCPNFDGGREYLINMIKSVRARTGLGLSESKALVEREWDFDKKMPRNPS